MELVKIRLDEWGGKGWGVDENSSGRGNEAG